MNQQLFSDDNKERLKAERLPFYFHRVTMIWWRGNPRISKYNLGGTWWEISIPGRETWIPLCKTLVKPHLCNVCKLTALPQKRWAQRQMPHKTSQDEDLPHQLLHSRRGLRTMSCSNLLFPNLPTRISSTDYIRGAGTLQAIFSKCSDSN